MSTIKCQNCGTLNRLVPGRAGPKCGKCKKALLQSALPPGSACKEEGKTSESEIALQFLGAIIAGCLTVYGNAVYFGWWGDLKLPGGPLGAWIVIITALFDLVAAGLILYLLVGATKLIFRACSRAIIRAGSPENTARVLVQSYKHYSHLTGAHETGLVGA